MKKKVLILVSLALLFTMLFNNVPAHAESINVSNDVSALELNQLIDSTNDLIEKTEANGSSVTEILHGQIAYYENLFQSSTLTDSQKITAEDLVVSLKNIIKDYEISSYELTKEGFELKSIENSKLNIQLYDLPIYVPVNPSYNACVVAVAACIAYFSASGYVLSAELLIHARDNKSYNSYYYPLHASLVKQSPVFTQLRNGSLNSGTSAFSNEGTTAQRDLYYAIHRFSWAKMWGTIHIYDTYNFELDLNYNNLFVAIGVNVMVLAQGYKIITPFKMEIQEY